MNAYNCKCKDCAITEEIFGEIYPGRLEDNLYDTLVPIQVKSYTITNQNRVEVTIITWGATIISIKCPDKYGHAIDVVLGFHDLESYLNPRLNSYIGCILGRCANRIKDGHFRIKDKDYYLTKNDLNNHHLHGGESGFGRRVWDSYIDGCSVVMTYVSVNGEEGYPGAVLATVRYKLTVDNKLEICMRATTTQPTVVNLSHASLFNLGGHDGGEKELKKHVVSLNCDRWTFVNYKDPIPTGAIRGVNGTRMDLRIPQQLEHYLEKIPSGHGYDHNFCVIRSWQPGASFVAKVLHPQNGRMLEIYSDQPGLQFYTCGNFIQTHSGLYKHWMSEKDLSENEESIEEESYPDTSQYILGKGGAQYRNYCALSIQPQNYPNAINYSHFPCSILYPGQVYYHDLTYKFGIQLSNAM